MKKIFSLSIVASCISVLFAQQATQLGKGSYAAYPPVAVSYEDGYFAAPYNWFEQAWPKLNLHDNARQKPIPTNNWWTDFIFRGLGRVQPEYHQPPVTVTTTGSRFGSEAWAYPHVVRSSQEGFEILFPKGFSGGGMNKGNPLKIHATSVLRMDNENFLFADFETAAWPNGWTVANNTQNIPGPMSASEIAQSPAPTGYTGNRWVNTFKGDGARMTLTSPRFMIEKDYIRLYVGGGNQADATYVGLFINGVKVRNATGQNSGVLSQQTWNVNEYKGQEAEIRIVDDTGSGWGFIMCDEIIFTDSELGGSGYTPDFRTDCAKVYDWSDLGFTLRSEYEGKYMDATIIHGVPFVYVELENLYPILVPGGIALAYDVNGQKIEEFPVNTHTFTIEFNDRIYGVHAPSGSKLYRSNGGDFQIEIPHGKRYVVVSVLPERALLGLYDQYARNKPGNVRFDYEYKISEGKIITTFDMDTKNLDTGETGQATLMSFLPHHYRTSKKNVDFIPGADYQLFIGRMQTGAAKSFSFYYDFGGMPPYLPEPLEMTDNRKNVMNSLLDYSSSHFGRNGNTYAKGLGEQSTMMLMAKALKHPGFDLFKNGLKTEFTDWFTFSDSERTQKSYYFAGYPDYGAVIGFPPGYGSQGFNDLHFHNGYFTVGAARLMMVDRDFKRDFAEMTKLITRTYANWDRYEENPDCYFPFLRTFDPYLGHSFAGGTGDGGGNNQESTSEAINSWFGIYLLGIELGDKKIIDTGAMGYLLEVISAGEYWLDLYDDNFSPAYPHEYVGILRTDNLARATYFSGDPAWALGIQACPVDFYYTNFGLNPEKMNSIHSAMLNERTSANAENYPGNADPYENIKAMGPYLGGYLLNILNYTDPVKSSQWLNEFCLDPVVGQNWRNHLNTTTNYYMSNAMITYGKPASGYHTSIASGAVYKNERGELTYLLYNPADTAAHVNIYQDGTIIETIKVEAGKYYNSRNTGVQKPDVRITSHKTNDKMALHSKVTVEAYASDGDGSILWVDFYLDGEKAGTSYEPPYRVSLRPATSGKKELKAIAVDNQGIEGESAIEIEVLSIAQTPFRSQPWHIPSEIIYAVQFDEGGSEIACHDNEIAMQGGTNYRPDTGVETEGTNNIPNSNIGWTNAGEWYEYTVNVQTAGVYFMTARLGSVNGGALRIFFDDTDMTGSVPVAPTGSWALVDAIPVAKISLKAGVQVMRVMIDKTGANLNSFRFTLLPDEPLASEVYAGDDQILSYPENTSAILTATAQTYGDVSVEKYEWVQVDGNPDVSITSPGSASTSVAGLQAGTYVFEARITDSNGKEVADRVAIVMKPDNFDPVAVPGNDRTIYSADETVELDGSASIDPDGAIIKYEWEQADANERLMIVQDDPANPKAEVSGFEAGKLYLFRLTVTDDKGATHSGNVRISVNTSTGTAQEAPKTDKTKIRVYPNPFKDNIRIQIEDSRGFEWLRLYSLTGQLIIDRNIQGLSEVELNALELDKGYYVLMIVSANNEILTYKLIK